MKLAVATSSLAVALVAAAAATVVMTGATAAPLSSAVSATATALSPRAAAAKRSLLDINDPNDHELHAAAEDDADEHNAMTSGYNLYAADAAHSSQEGRHRRLAYNGPMADVLADFEPLPCNAAVACDAATPLSSVLGGAGLVTLTCGTCYTVDQTGDVAIPGGLNIE